jgi:hypothetical protein
MAYELHGLLAGNVSIVTGNKEKRERTQFAAYTFKSLFF